MLYVHLLCHLFLPTFHKGWDFPQLSFCCCSIKTLFLLSFTIAAGLSSGRALALLIFFRCKITTWFFFPLNCLSLLPNVTNSLLPWVLAETLRSTSSSFCLHGSKTGADSCLTNAEVRFICSCVRYLQHVWVQLSSVIYHPLNLICAAKIQQTIEGNFSIAE